MTISKDFQVRRGLVVNTSLLVANTQTGRVGIGIDSPTSTLHVSGSANITSDVIVGGTLATIGPSLNVTSNVVVGGTLNVTGNTTIANLSANGVSAIDAENLVVSGNITAGNLIIQSTLALTTLTVSGNITSTNNITSSNNIVALVDVIATRNTVTGNITANGSLTVTGNVTAQNLTVSGTTSITAEELVIGTVKHNSYSVFANTTSSMEIDSFANAVRSALYTITANNANLDSYVTTLAVTGKGNLLEYGNVSSNGALATFSAAEVSGNVRVNAAATFANTTYYIYRITQGL